MARTVGQLHPRAARRVGRQRIYGYPGDGINGILGGFHAGDASGSSRPATRSWRRSRPARTRSSPARSACAWRRPDPARSTCSTASTTPSSTTSRSWRSSVSRRGTALGANYQQEIDLDALYKDVADEFVQVCMVPAQARHLVDRAVRVALSSRTVRRSSCPTTCRRSPTRTRRAPTARCSRRRATAPRIVPPTDALERAAEVLNAGEKVAMLVGAGRARRAGRGDRGRPRRSAPAWRRRSRHARPCPTTCRS